MSTPDLFFWKWEENEIENLQHTHKDTSKTGKTQGNHQIQVN